MADGANAAGATLGGTTVGSFSTMATNTGCDPNVQMLSLSLSKSQLKQTFVADAALPCPCDATNISLRMPGGAVYNLTRGPADSAARDPGHLSLSISDAYPAAFEAAFPAGDYTFTIQSWDFNQKVVVNLPSGPPAPHLTNDFAGQTINPTQPFLLGWDPLPGVSASDVIQMEIGHFNAPYCWGSFNGLATGVTIPAGTLRTNDTYSGHVTCSRCVLATNGTAYWTKTQNIRSTQFSLRTGSGGTP